MISAMMDMAGYVIPGYLPGIFGASRRFSFLFLHIETFCVIFSAKNHHFICFC